MWQNVWQKFRTTAAKKHSGRSGFIFYSSALGTDSPPAAVAVERQAVRDLNGIPRPNNRITPTGASERCRQRVLEAASWSGRDLHAPLVELSVALKSFSFMIWTVHFNYLQHVSGAANWPDLSHHSGEVFLFMVIVVIKINTEGCRTSVSEYSYLLLFLCSLCNTQRLGVCLACLWPTRLLLERFS